MLKTIICVENYVETACWKFQHVLNTVMHAESHVKTSRRVENVYVNHVENHIENHVEVRKKDHHTLRHVSKLSGRFRFSPSVCTSYWSETYVKLGCFCSKCPIGCRKFATCHIPYTSHSCMPHPHTSWWCHPFQINHMELAQSPMCNSYTSWFFMCSLQVLHHG